MKDGSMITSLQIAAYTHTGLYRRRNEDSMLVSGRVYSGISMEAPVLSTEGQFPVILAVADGIGGSVAGDVASRSVLEFIATRPVPDNEDALKEVVTSSGKHLDHLVRSNPALFGLGTTISGILCSQAGITIFSCGDSRVYLRSEHGSLTLMTRDHSVVQEMIDAGTLTEEKARSHPFGHIITSCISGGGTSPHPDIRTGEIMPNNGDRVIICTDGVWDYGGSEFLQAAISGDPCTAVSRIRDICMEKGAPDNITLIIGDIVTSPDAREG
ncbi:MAG: protein phosphatase 2C domain-containing protein [Methanospirillum sp.]|nr:protein phosphatase 2C domain-containing protein [Methanospirillum sp.]